MKFNKRVVLALMRATGALTALVAIVEAGSKWS